jgi:hypothetical protein
MITYKLYTSTPGNPNDYNYHSTAETTPQLNKLLDVLREQGYNVKVLTIYPNGTQCIGDYHATATQEEAQEETAPEMVNTRDLLDDLDTGDYGGNLNDYRDSSDYICDAIQEIADNNTSIYYYDIKRFISDNVEAVEDAINEFGWDGCGGDLMKAGQMGEFITIERDIYDHLADSLLAAAVDFIRYDLDREQIPAELAELLREWADAADNNDRMDDIPDKIRAYFEAENDEQEAI